MSYKIDKQFISSTSILPTAQSISTSYTEATGSKVQINIKNTNASWLYKYSFYTFSTDPGSLFIHAQVETSNDDFSSDINTIAGAQTNISGDTIDANDKYYQAHTIMFILTSLNKNYLRLRVRAYSSNTECILHRSTEFDGGTTEDVSYNPSLTVMEL